MSRSLQLWGLASLTALGLGLLWLIGSTFSIVGHHIGADGRVPSAEAFGLSALLLSFRSVIGAIGAIWSTAATSALTDKLAASSPVAPPAVEPANGETA